MFLHLSGHVDEFICSSLDITHFVVQGVQSSALPLRNLENKRHGGVYLMCSQLASLYPWALKDRRKIWTG